MQIVKHSKARALALACFAFIALTTQAFAEITGKVVSVTDGDTIKVLDSQNKEHKIRLGGIDAPEKSQPYGRASQKNLASLIAGKQVTVQASKTDRYGRTIGKVLVDGNDVNLEQVRAGYAWWYRYYKSDQSPEDQRAYETAEDSAKASQAGLWKDPNPINPYDWRKGKR